MGVGARESYRCETDAAQASHAGFAKEPRNMQLQSPRQNRLSAGSQTDS